MLNALSPKRLELLRAVHDSPARSVKALAERLGRDYKRVHEDVETLTASGLREVLMVLRRAQGARPLMFECFGDLPAGLAGELPVAVDRTGAKMPASSARDQRIPHFALRLRSDQTNRTLGFALPLRVVVRSPSRESHQFHEQIVG